MEEPEKYKQSVLLFDFQRYNSDGKYYELIRSWRSNEIEKLANYPPKLQHLLKDYLFLLEDLANNIFELYSASFRLEETPAAFNTFNLSYLKIEAGLAELPKYVQVVSENFKQQKVEDALYLQRMLDILFNDLLVLLQILGIKTKESPLNKAFKAAKKNIERLKISKIEKHPANDTEVKTNKKPIEENIWFKVGLTFATGKAQELLKKHKIGQGEYVKGYFSKITKELGFKPTDRVYFSQTFNNTTSDNKNIYSQLEKLHQIFQYCQNHNIKVVEDFHKHLSKETT